MLPPIKLTKNNVFSGMRQAPLMAFALSIPITAKPAILAMTKYPSINLSMSFPPSFEF